MDAREPMELKMRAKLTHRSCKAQRRSLLHPRLSTSPLPEQRLGRIKKLELDDAPIQSNGITVSVTIPR